MHELNKQDLYSALAYAKSIDEDNIRKIIERFHADQGTLAGTIFGIFPAVIAAKDQDMAYLFSVMDLCFDVICIGKPFSGPRYENYPDHDLRGHSLTLQPV